MTLYKASLRDSECCHVLASLDDIKANLAEQGLAVVPVDPTKEMIEIGGKAIEQCFFARYATTRADQAYRAMIKAAGEG